MWSRWKANRPARRRVPRPGRRPCSRCWSTPGGPGGKIERLFGPARDMSPGFDGPFISGGSCLAATSRARPQCATGEPADSRWRRDPGCRAICWPGHRRQPALVLQQQRSFDELFVIEPTGNASQSLPRGAVRAARDRKPSCRRWRRCARSKAEPKVRRCAASPRARSRPRVRRSGLGQRGRCDAQGARQQRKHGCRGRDSPARPRHLAGGVVLRHGSVLSLAQL